eukprot:Nk52_evm14s2402 gene=Nk52_evmTU14s2402
MLNPTKKFPNPTPHLFFFSILFLLINYQQIQSLKASKSQDKYSYFTYLCFEIPSACTYHRSITSNQLENQSLPVVDLHIQTNISDQLHYAVRYVAGGDQIHLESSQYPNDIVFQRSNVIGELPLRFVTLSQPFVVNLQLDEEKNKKEGEEATRTVEIQNPFEQIRLRKLTIEFDGFASFGDFFSRGDSTIGGLNASFLESLHVHITARDINQPFHFDDGTWSSLGASLTYLKISYAWRGLNRDEEDFPVVQFSSDFLVGMMRRLERIRIDVPAANLSSLVIDNNNGWRLRKLRITKAYLLPNRSRLIGGGGGKSGNSNNDVAKQVQYEDLLENVELTTMQSQWRHVVSSLPAHYFTTPSPSSASSVSSASPYLKRLKLAPERINVTYPDRFYFHSHRPVDPLYRGVGEADIIPFMNKHYEQFAVWKFDLEPLKQLELLAIEWFYVPFEHVFYNNVTRPPEDKRQPQQPQQAASSSSAGAVELNVRLKECIVFSMYSGLKNTTSYNNSYELRAKNIAKLHLESVLFVNKVFWLGELRVALDWDGLLTSLFQELNIIRVLEFSVMRLVDLHFYDLLTFKSVIEELNVVSSSSNSSFVSSPSNISSPVVSAAQLPSPEDIIYYIILSGKFTVNETHQLVALDHVFAQSTIFQNLTALALRDVNLPTLDFLVPSSEDNNSVSVVEGYGVMASYNRSYLEHIELSNTNTTDFSGLFSFRKYNRCHTHVNRLQTMLLRNQTEGPKRLHKGDFCGFESLQSASFERTTISDFDMETFHNVTFNITLRESQLTRLPEHFLAGTHLNTLDVSDNALLVSFPVEWCPSMNCSVRNLSASNCALTPGGLQAGGLLKLLFGGNGLLSSNIAEDVFLDVSFNRIDGNVTFNLTETFEEIIYHVAASSDSLFRLPEDIAIPPFPAVSLNFSYNGMTKYCVLLSTDGIGTNSSTGRKSLVTVKSLDLSYNRLVSADSLFTPDIDMWDLLLSHNQIKMLPPSSVLAPCVNLSIFDVSYNLLTTLPPGLLKKHGKLKRFSASHNQISRLQEVFMEHSCWNHAAPGAATGGYTGFIRFQNGCEVDLSCNGLGEDIQFANPSMWIQSSRVVFLNLTNNSYTQYPSNIDIWNLTREMQQLHYWDPSMPRKISFAHNHIRTLDAPLCAGLKRPADKIGSSDLVIDQGPALSIDLSWNRIVRVYTERTFRCTSHFLLNLQHNRYLRALSLMCGKDASSKCMDYSPADVSGAAGSNFQSTLYVLDVRGTMIQSFPWEFFKYHTNLKVLGTGPIDLSGSSSNETSQPDLKNVSRSSVADGSDVADGDEHNPSYVPTPVLDCCGFGTNSVVYTPTLRRLTELQQAPGNEQYVADYFVIEYLSLKRYALFDAYNRTRCVYQEWDASVQKYKPSTISLADFFGAKDDSSSYCGQCGNLQCAGFDSTVTDSSSSLSGESGVRPGPYAKRVDLNYGGKCSFESDVHALSAFCVCKNHVEYYGDGYICDYQPAEVPRVQNETVLSGVRDSNSAGTCGECPTGSICNSTTLVCDCEDRNLGNEYSQCPFFYEYNGTNQLGPASISEVEKRQLGRLCVNRITVNTVYGGQEPCPVFVNGTGESLWDVLDLMFSVVVIFLCCYVVLVYQGVMRVREKLREQERAERYGEDVVFEFEMVPPDAVVNVYCCNHLRESLDDETLGWAQEKFEWCFDREFLLVVGEFLDDGSDSNAVPGADKCSSAFFLFSLLSQCIHGTKANKKVKDTQRQRKSNNSMGIEGAGNGQNVVAVDSKGYAEILPSSGNSTHRYGSYSYSGTYTYDDNEEAKGHHSREEGSIGNSNHYNTTLKHQSSLGALEGTTGVQQSVISDVSGGPRYISFPATSSVTSGGDYISSGQTPMEHEEEYTEWYEYQYKYNEEEG